MPYTATQMRSKSIHSAGEVKPGYQRAFSGSLHCSCTSFHDGVNYVLHPLHRFSSRTTLPDSPLLVPFQYQLLGCFARPCVAPTTHCDDSLLPAPALLAYPFHKCSTQGTWRPSCLCGAGSNCSLPPNRPE